MANQPKKYKKFVASAATATLVASAIVSVASAAEFKDVTGNDHEVAINALAKDGIIKGYADGTFKPNQTINRGQVVKLLGRWLEEQGEEIPADWKTEQRFTDLPVTAEEELVKYAALAKDAGVFAGSNGKLNYTQTMQRQQMAVVLVRAIEQIGGVDLVAEYKEAGFVTEITDLDKAYSAEQRNAIVALEYAGITNVSSFNPGNSVTRGQFASFLYRTINNVLEAPVAGVASIKAINNTTVEVTFEDEVDNINALHFVVSDLEVKNAAVKQTNKKVVVLTTAAQTADKEYTVSLNEEKVGSFKGIAAVIPTKVDVKTSSVQGIIGKEVTLQAEVTVAEGQSKAGIPVTFNIVSDNSNVNSKVEVEVLTDDKGVASYSYTRYYSHNDNVTAYATQKSSVASQAKVYWENKIQLAVSEITTGNELTNNTKKSYKVVGEKNTTYYIAIKENLEVTPDKITKVSVQDHNNVNNFVTPYELTTGEDKFARVQTNANGEATFTVYGSNLSATPIVYLPSSVNKSATDYTYSKLALQADVPTVKFSQIDKLALSVVAEGTADSAEYLNVPVAYDQNSVGGRTYTVTVTDKDGKLAPEGTVAYVTFEENNISGSVYFSTGKNNFKSVSKGSVEQITVGKDGKAQFRVAGNGATTFVKPTVFLNTAGTSSPVVLDKTGSQTDVQTVTDSTFFKKSEVTNATLKVTDVYGRTITSTESGKDAYFTYQSVDQNGFDYRPNGYNTTGNITQIVWKPVTQADGSIIWVQETQTITGSTVYEYALAFDVTSTFGNAKVSNAAGVALNPSQNLGNTKTYQVKSDATGKAIVRVTSETADTVSVNVTGASNILPTQTASVTFAASNLVPDLYSGVVASYNSEKGKLTFQGKKEVDLYGDKIFYTKNKEVVANYEAFIYLLENATGTVSVTREVKDGVTTFNIYNISTSGTKPVDTANSVTVAQALANAIAAGKAVDASKYTAASVTEVKNAVAAAEALVSATDSQKIAATSAINNAIAKLVPVPPVDGFNFTSKEYKENDTLKVLYDYNIAGTLAASVGEVASVKVVLKAASGEVTSEIDVKYDASNRKFEFVTSNAKAAEAKFIAYDKDGKVLSTTELEFK